MSTQISIIGEKGLLIYKEIQEDGQTSMLVSNVQRELQEGEQVSTLITDVQKLTERLHKKMHTPSSTDKRLLITKNIREMWQSDLAACDPKIFNERLAQAREICKIRHEEMEKLDAPKEPPQNL